MTASQEDYLKSIYILILHKNEARVTDIADYLQVSKASVNRALKSLKELGLVDYETYRCIHRKWLYQRRNENDK